MHDWAETFDDMRLSTALLRGVYGYGLERASHVQQQAVVPLVKGHDLILQAASGTGKTTALCLAALQRLDLGLQQCLAVIIANTRELAHGIHSMVTALAKHMDGFTSHLLVKGSDAPGADVCLVVCTPGALLRCIRRQWVCMDQVTALVLDPADELLVSGYSEQLEEIFDGMPARVQLCMSTSSTLDELLQLTARLTRHPELVKINPPELTLDGIRQYYVDVEEEKRKAEVLCDLNEYLHPQQMLVFVNTTRKAMWLNDHLQSQSILSECVHQLMPREQRLAVLRQLHTGSLRVVVATDVVQREDVLYVHLVFNYDLPLQPNAYLRRIGRSGHFGRKITAVNLVTSEDKPTIAELERFFATQIEELPADVDSIL